MRRLLIAALAGAVLAGCSTSAVPPSQAVKSTKVFAYQSTPKTPFGTLTVTRDAGFISSGCDMAVFVNGQLAAKLATKETATFKIPAGEVIVGAGIVGSGICSTAAERREREVRLSEGQHKKYRIFISSEADVDILPTTL